MGRPPLQSTERTKRNRNAVRRWKEKNPERVAAQKKRASQRKRIEKAEEKRKMDPTMQLAFRPANGVETAPTGESNPTDIRPDPGPPSPRGPGSDPATGPLERLDPLADERLRPDSPLPHEKENGILEPEEFNAEAKRLTDFRKLKLLHDFRLSLSGEKPGIETDL